MKPITPIDPHLIAADVHAAGRRIAPFLRQDLPALLGREAHGLLHKLAGKAEERRMLEPSAHDMLRAVIAVCDREVRAGTTMGEEWYEAGYSDGAPDYACRTITVFTPRAADIDRLRARLAELHELLERVLDLQTAQNTAPGLHG